MAFLPTETGGFDIKRALQALSQGLGAASQGGFGAFGPATIGATQQYDDRTRQAATDKMLAELRQMQIEQARTANTDAAETKKRQADFLASIGNGPQAPNNGRPGGMAGPQQSGWTPEQMSYFQAFPDQADDIIGQKLFPTDDPADAPTVKDFYEGGKVVQKQWNAQTGQWDAVGEGPRWAPNQPAASDGIWSPYVDPKSGRTGQKNSKTGKIDWDPGNTMMVQTGTDQNGNPIYDMVSTSAGKPPSESNIQAGIRGTLVESAIKNIRDITSNTDGISPLRMATADTIGEKGPMGAYGANVLRTDDEKKYSAAISKGVEGLVAAITGAGVAKDQFPRIQNLIPGPTDSPEVINWKLDQLGPVLDVLLAGSGPLALAGDKKPGAAAPAPGPTGGAVEWERGPDGKPRKKVAP